MSPTISVIVPVYKETVQLLQRSVTSIREQTFSDFELILVIDNPDNREAISYLTALANEDNRIRLIFHGRNLGPSRARNTGIQAARGKYIAMMDADDASLPNRFREQHAFLETNPDVHLVGCAIDYIEDETENHLFTRTYPLLVGSEIKRADPLPMPGVMLRTSVFATFGFFEPHFAPGNDYHLWLKYFLKGVVMCNLAGVHLRYYQHGGSIKKSHTKIQLKNTILYKLSYARRLKFSLSDYLYIAGEALLLLLPAHLVTQIFYRYQKILSNREDNTLIWNSPQRRI